MATNLAIDPKLLDKAVQVSGARSKTVAITKALEEYVACRQQRKLLELFNALDWDPTYDYEKERSRR